MSQQPTLAEAYQNKESFLNQISNSIMQSDFPEVRNIYIDLNTLKDTRLGTMVAYAPSKDALIYLIDGIEDYNIRYKRSFKYAYPDYPLTELELEMKYRDPSCSQVIFSRSPDTDFCIHFFEYLSVIREQNQRAGYNGIVNIHINIFPLSITPAIKTWIEAFQNFMPGFKYHLFSEDHKKINLQLLYATQIFIFNSLLPYLDPQSTLHEPLFVKGSMRTVEVFAPREIEDKFLTQFKENGFLEEDEASPIEDMFEMTSLVMLMCCKFKYMQFNIPNPKVRMRHGKS